MELRISPAEMMKIRQTEDVTAYFRDKGLEISEDAAKRLLKSILFYVKEASPWFILPDKPMDRLEDYYTIVGEKRVFSAACPRPVRALRVVMPDIGPQETVTRILSTELLRSKGPDTVVIPENISRIQNCCFINHTGLKRVVIPRTVREIPAGAFINCGQLTEVILPETIVRIGPAAFDGCKSLQRITLPEDLTTVGCGAFRNCASLSEVTAPPGFRFPAEWHIFDGCGSLDVSGLNIGPLNEEIRAAFEELEDALDTISWAYLGGTNSQYTFLLEEIDPPDEEDLEEEAADPDADLLDFAQSADTGIFIPEHVDPAVITDHQRFLKDILADTFRTAGVRICHASKAGWQKYEEQTECFSMQDLRLIRAGNAWYVLLIDWSD